MGAGMPKFRIWLTMSGAEKKKSMSGNFWCSCVRSVRTYPAVGWWPSFSATRISPSSAPIVALSLKARLMPLVGSPMLSSTVLISAAGTTCRIACPTW